jgi:hypothetical protein
MEDFRSMIKINIYRLLALTVLATAWLWAGACSGSSSVDNNIPGPGGNINESLGGVTGTIVDREGNPVGGFNTLIRVTNLNGINVSPDFSPPAAGPEAGQFTIQNLPLNQILVFEAEHMDSTVGRNLGYKQEVFFNSPGVVNLGMVKLDNPWLQLGWDSYKQRDYHQSIYYFNRSLSSRTLSATGDFTLSSSAYDGLAWIYAKRGRDNFATNPMFAGFEWDQALIEFDKGGTLFTLIANVNSDPVQIGPWLPIYGYLKPLFPEAYQALERALLANPNYNCEHDLIKADDLRVTQLALIWLNGGTVTLNEVENYSDNGKLNEGSMQLLSVLPDLLLYEPYPQR